MLKLLFILAVALAANAATDPNYRLNTPIVPKSYALTITPYFDTGNDRAFTFDGEVTIKFTTNNATNEIKLHSEDLHYNISNVRLLIGTTAVQLTELTFDTKYTFVYIKLPSDLQTGIEYTLTITYTGPIRSDLNGFYHNYYIQNGTKKWLGATQMEPTHARKVFPCFDEPGLKATFALTIDRPANYKPTLTNTKLQATVNLPNGMVRETFHETPVMSTYLVAFLISEFESYNYYVNGTKEFGVWSRPDAKNQSKYAHEVGLKIVDELGKYFGIDYYEMNPYLKLDHIALPDFRSGAMENWGLIKYREALLLFDPEESTPYYKYRVAQIIAHETTHMWFGNLVTCHWWSNTWLNEGFANYFQDYITAFVDPDVGSADILVTGSVYSAYDADDSAKAVPITNDNVNSPAEISGHFGTITYQKAGSVIRMMHHLVGDDVFRIGLRSYLSANKFESGYPDLMYSALEQSVNATNALADYPEFTFTEIMKSWIEQAGHPLLHVKIDFNTGNVTLTQERFYTNPSENSNELYKIPVTYTTGASPNFEITKPAFIMADKEHTFTIQNFSHDWVIFNIQESGLYRVHYDDMSWQHIIAALSEEKEKINHLNRAKIINDIFALFFADKVKFQPVNEALNTLKNETDYSVWTAAIRGLTRLRSKFIGSTTLETIDASIKGLLDFGIEVVGYDVQPNESTPKLRNRMQILELACMIGHEECVQKMTELFKNFRQNGVEITPSLRPVAYCQGLKNGAAEDFEFLWQRMASTNVANEATIIATALGCSSDDASLKTYLLSRKNTESPIRYQDYDVPLNSVLSHYDNVQLVIGELKSNFKEWTTLYPSMEGTLSSIASALRTEAEFTEYEEWLNSCTECTSEALTAAREALQVSRNTATWAKNHSADVLSTLKNNAIITSPSVMLLAIVFVVTFIKN